MVYPLPGLRPDEGDESLQRFGGAGEEEHPSTRSGYSGGQHQSSRQQASPD